MSLVDALVAAARPLPVLRYDADFELSAEMTGLNQEWVVRQGIAD